MGNLTMNLKEREQAKIFEQLKEGQITRAEAATRAQITPRWLREKYKRYLLQADAGLVHRSRGLTKCTSWDAKNGEFLEKLFEGDWYDFGPKFTAEKLAKLHGIQVSKETARQCMISRKLWKPKQRKQKHRIQRERKEMLGMMIQLDGSPHAWFGDRADKCTLLVFIDDATSRILWLEFAESESKIALMKATKSYIRKHGIPHYFYVDHGSVYHVNLNNPEHDKITDWERVIGELRSKVIHAHSAQAKGRVERCNGTMQDRLIKDMRLAGISSINEANKFLQAGDYIEEHNQQFGKPAATQGDAHRDAQEYDLDGIFTIQTTRILANDFTITYKTRIFQVEEQRRAIIRPKNEVTVCEGLDGSIRLKIRRLWLPCHEIKKRSTPVVVQELPQVNEVYRRPSENSRRWVDGGAQWRSRMKPAVPAAEAQLK